MKTPFLIHKEGECFVAITNVAEQGLTENETVSNLKKGIEGL